MGKEGGGSSRYDNQGYRKRGGAQNFQTTDDV